jgi:hypothetical protein
MTLSKKLLLAALPVALLASAAAAQQAPANPGTAETAIAAGAKVLDPKGGEVGTVSEVDGQFVILKTDKHEARLPLSSLSAREGGFVMAMTRDQLNAEVEKATASSEADKAAPSPGARPQ